jgi:MerR family mercuric resistance operon transcriptional regulator/MerR family gold-responsive transcriptional activator of gol and ges genes
MHYGVVGSTVSDIRHYELYNCYRVTATDSEPRSSVRLDSISRYRLYRQLTGRETMVMTIGDVAADARVNVQTVRYYERRGLLPRAPRTPSGYRLYGDETVRRLKFIKGAQELGFTLAEVKELLTLRVHRASACGQVEAKARKKITLVNQKIEELDRMRRALERLVSSCRARKQTADCPILDAIESEGDVT